MFAKLKEHKMKTPKISTATTKLELAHRLWIRKGRAIAATRDPFTPCENCDCEGNNECGHDCLDGFQMCTLDLDTMLCPCCAIIDTPATDAEYDASVGQTDMFRGDA